MPTKPVLDPEPWATTATYPNSVYPPEYPWEIAHPDAGNVTPWSLQPRRNATGLAGFAAAGAVPLEAQAGDIWNEEFARVVALANWVFLGSSSPDEDAHLIETDALGNAMIASLEVGGGAQNLGLIVNATVGTDAIIVNGGAERAISAINSDAASPTLELANADAAGVALIVTGTSTVAAVDLNNTGASHCLRTRSTVQCDAIVNLLGGANLAGQEIEGAAGSVVDVETVEPDRVLFEDQVSTFSVVAHRVQYNDTNLMIGRRDSSVANPIDVVPRGWDRTFSSPNAIDDTTAVAVRFVREDEPVHIKVTARFSNATNPANLNYRIEVTGTPGTVEPELTAFIIPTANDNYPFSQVYRWTPTDDFVTPGTVGYTFTARFGTSAGTVNMSSISIEVASALEV